MRTEGKLDSIWTCYSCILQSANLANEKCWKGRNKKQEKSEKEAVEEDKKDKQEISWNGDK